MAELLETLPQLLSWIALGLGSFFCVVSGIGLLRLPDIYSRGHGASIGDTLGAALILGGLMLQEGASLVSVKLAMLVFFLWLIVPMVNHMVLKAAYARGLPFNGQERSEREGESPLLQSGESDR